MSTFVSLLLLRMLSCIRDMATSSVGAVVAGSNLKCSICLELFNDPRLLPCLHTYCLRCLQGLVSNKKSDFSCPKCRAKHEIPKDGLGSYLSDFSILPELEAAKRQGQKKICGFCTTGEVAVGYCNDCGVYLCECCRDVVHKRGKMFISHSVSSIEEAISITSSNLTRFFKQISLCSFHPKYELEIFCKTCDILVCSMCMLETTHKGHSYDFFKNVQDELMERIKSMTQRVKEKENIVKNSLSFVKKFEQQVCSQRDKLEAEINSTCDEYIKKVQAMKEELLKQVESKFTEDRKTIWATKDHLEVMLYQIQSCEAFSKRYKKQGSEGQMLPLLNQLLHCLTKLDGKDIDFSVIFSTATQRTKFLMSYQEFTSIGALYVDKKKRVFVYGKLDKSVIVLGEKNTLVYILNEPLAQLVKWECKYSHYHIPSKSLTSTTCHVVVTGDNQLKIKFIPTLPGEYKFQLIPTGCSVVGVQTFTIYA